MILLQGFVSFTSASISRYNKYYWIWRVIRLKQKNSLNSCVTGWRTFLAMLWVNKYGGTACSNVVYAASKIQINQPSFVCMSSSHFNCIWLFVTLWTIACQAALEVCGILQARILEWVAMPSSRGSSQYRDQIWDSYVSWIGRQFL